MTSSGLPSDLRARLSAILETEGLEADRILLFNPRKPQVTVKARSWSGVNCLLKLTSEDSDALGQERAFYRMEEASGPHVPEVYSIGPNYVVLRYYRGRTLRECLANASPAQAKALCTTLMRTLHDLYELDSLYVDSDARCMIQTRYARLLCSGQEGSRRSRVTDGFFRIVAGFSEPLVGRLLPDTTGTMQVIHGDLHPNNVLVCADGRMKIIDWENWTRGSALVDLLYLLPVLDKKISLRRSFPDEPLLTSLPSAAYAVMRWAASSNSRF